MHQPGLHDRGPTEVNHPDPRGRFRGSRACGTGQEGLTDPRPAKLDRARSPPKRPSTPNLFRVRRPPPSSSRWRCTSPRRGKCTSRRSVSPPGPSSPRTTRSARHTRAWRSRHRSDRHRPLPAVRASATLPSTIASAVASLASNAVSAPSPGPGSVRASAPASSRGPPRVPDSCVYVASVAGAVESGEPELATSASPSAGSFAPTAQPLRSPAPSAHAAIACKRRRRAETRSFPAPFTPSPGHTGAASATFPRARVAKLVSYPNAFKASRRKARRTTERQEGASSSFRTRCQWAHTCRHAVRSRLRDPRWRHSLGMFTNRCERDTLLEGSISR